jgi:hypothetical protein
MTEETIGGIKASAPLFNNAGTEQLRAIVALLSQASCHYADDSAKEWGAGHAAVLAAAKSINFWLLGLVAITALHKETSQLVSLEQLIDTVLRDARK